MKKIVLLIHCFALFVFSSCDKVEAPYNEAAIIPVDTTTSVKQRKILIEDFTGHTCPGCPRAAERIAQLQLLKPGRVIAIGEHVSEFFAAPEPGIYNIDFRTATGNANDSAFHMSDLGLPTGMVNRLFIAGSYRTEYASWASIADTLLQKPAEAFITITNTYDTTSRTLNTSVKSEFLTSLNSTFKLAVYITEDSIIAAQKDNLVPNPSDVLNYVHQHVLRTSVNGTFGETIASGAVANNFSVNKNYSKQISTLWKAKHCNVVAFIYDAVSKKVIQAEEKGISTK